MTAPSTCSTWLFGSSDSGHISPVDIHSSKGTHFGGANPYFSPQTPNHKGPPLCTFGYLRISVGGVGPGYALAFKYLVWHPQFLPGLTSLTVASIRLHNPSLGIVRVLMHVDSSILLFAWSADTLAALQRISQRSRSQS